MGGYDRDTISVDQEVGQRPNKGRQERRMKMCLDVPPSELPASTYGIDLTPSAALRPICDELGVATSTKAITTVNGTS